MNLRILALYSIALWLCVSACKFQRIRRSTDLKEKYDAAMRYYERKDYSRTLMLLEEIIPLITGTKESERAQFAFAYCHFNLKQYAEAAHYFRKYYDTFRNSPNAQEARFMQVRALYEDSPAYYLDQKSTIDAVNATQSFLNAYPLSDFAEQATRIIKEQRKKLEKKGFENARLYYKIHSYKAAVVSFTNFQKNFPDSDLNEEAAYLKIDAQYRYAQQSIDLKKRERLREVIQYCETFTETFNDSRYQRSVKNLFEKSTDQIARLEKKPGFAEASLK